MQTNNKLREALIQIYDRVNSLDENCAVDPVEIRDIARAALAAPPRNCDVGTAEEQENRFHTFCGSLPCDHLCPARMSDDVCQTECVVAWAQMPYDEEEGEAK